MKHIQTQNKAQGLAACGHVSARSQSMRFILSLRMFISFITSRPGVGDKESKTNSRNRGSYISAHVLLNLLNGLMKKDKMRGLPTIFSHFRNEFNKLKNTGAHMLGFFLSYDTKTTFKSRFLN